MVQSTKIQKRDGLEMTPVVFLPSWRSTQSDVMVTTCTSMITVPAKRRNTELQQLRLPGYESNAPKVFALPLGKKRKHQYLHKEREAFLSQLYIERRQRAALETWAAVKVQSATRGFLVRRKLQKECSEAHSAHDHIKSPEACTELLNKSNFNSLSVSEIRRALLEMSELTERQIALDAAADAGEPLRNRRAVWGTIKRKQRTKRRKTKRKYAACIQKVVRGFLARRVVQRMHQRESEIHRRAQVLKIQALARGYLTRNGTSQQREEYAEHAAITLQAHIRGWTTRIKIKRLRERLREEVILYNAAIRIQKIFRGRLGRRKGHYNLQQRASIKIQSRYRGLQARRLNIQHHKAATIISSQYRGRITRKKYREQRRKLMIEKHHTAATHIQKLARGKAARLRVSHLLDRRQREQDENALKEKERAAISIQSVHRGRKGRRSFRRAREERRKHIAAVKIQSSIRKRDAMKTASKKRELRDREAAALSIQRLHRGRTGRKHHRVKERQRERQNNAAISLQRIHRGYSARKYVSLVKQERDLERSNEAAVALQKMVRGYQSRQQVARVRAANRADLERDRDSAPKRAVRRAGRKSKT